MSYKSELNKEELSRWEDTKRSIEINMKEKILNKPSFLGECHVNLSYIDGELSFEIMPNETVNFEGDIEGVIVNVDEDKCHLTSIMSMINNARDTEEAKRNCKPIKRFTNTSGLKIH